MVKTVRSYAQRLQVVGQFLVRRGLRRMLGLPPKRSLASWNTLFRQNVSETLAGEKRELETFDLSMLATLNSPRLLGQIVFEYGTLVNAVDGWAGRTVLDIGSGRSTFPHWMAHRGASVLTFEYPRQIETKTQGRWGRLNAWSQPRLDNEALRESFGNMLQMSFPDGAFDLVTSFSVLEHLDTDIDTLDYVPYPEQKRRLHMALDEMIRVAKPGGLIYITSECCDYEHATEDAWRSSYYFKDGPANTISSAWPAKEVPELFYEFFERHGCRLVGPLEFHPRLLANADYNTFRGAYFSAFSVLVEKVS